MSEPLTWVHSLADIGHEGLASERHASEVERMTLARQLDIVAVDRLHARYEIRPLGRGRYRLTGEIDAAVTQSCVITLDPVAGRITESFEAEFMPARDMPRAERQEQEMEALAAQHLEPIAHDRIEVGRIVYEHFAAALDPYPRKEEARLTQPEEAPEEAESPFAALAKLKPPR